MGALGRLPSLQSHESGKANLTDVEVMGEICEMEAGARALWRKDREQTAL